MRSILLLLLALTLCATGCPPAEEPTAGPAETPPPAGADAEPDAPADADAPAAAPTEAVQPDVDRPVSGVYDVECGCTIEAVGHCGEYAELDGHQVEITGDLGLGSMPFCGKSGLKAEIEGEVKDGKLVATKLTIVE